MGAKADYTRDCRGRKRLGLDGSLISRGCACPSRPGSIARPHSGGYHNLWAIQILRWSCEVETVEVTVEFFGIPRQRGGRAELTVQARTIDDLLSAVERACPGLAPLVRSDARPELRPI